MKWGTRTCERVGIPDASLSVSDGHGQFRRRNLPLKLNGPRAGPGRLGGGGAGKLPPGPGRAAAAIICPALRRGSGGDVRVTPGQARVLHGGPGRWRPAAGVGRGRVTVRRRG